MRGSHFDEGSSTFRGHSPYCPKAQPTLHVLSILASSAPRPNQQHLVRRQLEITTVSCEAQVQGLWNYAEFEGPPCRIVSEILVFETMSRWILQDEASPMPPQSVYMVSKTKQQVYVIT